MAGSAKATQGFRALLDAASAAQVPVRTVSRGELDALAPDHQGVVARIRKPGGAARIRELTERDLAGLPFAEDAVVVLLDGITDPQNLGAAARSAEAAGAPIVTRTRRAAEVSDAAVRASAGALLHLPHARVANIARAVERLQEAGFWAIGLDGSANSTIYDDPVPPAAWRVSAARRRGSRVSSGSRDRVVALPMCGRFASLNASASLAAALYGYVLPSRTHA